MNVGVEKERELKRRNIKCVGADETNQPTQERVAETEREKDEFISSRGHIFG